jgi:hypothetical protein
MSLYIARGNEVFFEVTFLDITRQPMAPPSANLYVSYKDSGVRTTATIPMVSAGSGVFTATWNSAPADPGLIEWHARAGGGDPAAEDGSFQLIANNANPST